MNHHNLRLIEDYLPIEAISAEASREKSVRKGHISTLHLWWARRPLVACRAAVYGALVPADRWVKDVELKNPPADPETAERFRNGAKRGLNRRAAAEFMTRLCKYPGDPKVIAQARRHILEAHAERLTQERGTGGPPVTVEDIEAGRAPRPRVLDMFAGGGAIPLEALRLGCEAYALDLNPVAHIIELCTLVYPQKYGQPDPTVRGMTGPRQAGGLSSTCGQAGGLSSTWGGLANEVRYWGNWVLNKVKAEIGDLYPLIPDPIADTGQRPVPPSQGGEKSNKNSGTGRRPVQDTLFTTRRNLPHWEMGGSTYFITYRCAPGRILAEADRNIVLDNWRHWHGKRYLLHCAVVMPDHVHVLLTPLKNGPGTWHSLEEILHTNKGFTAQQINQRNRTCGSVWQDERYDRIMRDEEEFLEKWNYIANNAVKAGLANKPLEYPWYYQDPQAWDEQGTGQRPVPPRQNSSEVIRVGGTGGSPVPDGGTGGSPVPDEVPPGYLMPVAYLWTRTVTCKNPTCKAIVPLVRQTWLCKKKGRYVALKMVADTGQRPVPPSQGGDTGQRPVPPSQGGDTGQRSVPPSQGGDTGQRPVPPSQGGDTGQRPVPPNQGGDTGQRPVPPNQGGDTGQRPVPPSQGGDTGQRSVPPSQGGDTGQRPVPPSQGGEKTKKDSGTGGPDSGTGGPDSGTGGSPVPGKVRFEVVESDTEKGLGFDPAGFSKAGNATCPFCGTVADNKYVKQEGQAGRLSSQMMAVVCTRPGKQGKVYLSVEQASSLLERKSKDGGTGRSPVPASPSTGQRPVPPKFVPDEEEIRRRIADLCQRTGLTVPDEPVPQADSFTCKTHLYGMRTWASLFTPRQMLCLLTFAAAVREAHQKMVGQAAGLSKTSTGGPPVPPIPGYDPERAKAVATYLAAAVNRIADRGSNLCHWDNAYTKTANTFGRQALPMVWDFAEANPFGESSGDASQAIEWVASVAEAQSVVDIPATVTRGSATALPWGDGSDTPSWPGGTGGSPVPSTTTGQRPVLQFDAVITDPPYYDNVSYSNLSDFFYVWLKRTIGHLYPEHFATQGTPKKQEAVADASRHAGDKAKARRAYEQMMAQALAEANRVLKPGGVLVVVYAHKTTLGWATLVDALRKAGFIITEAWPLDTEMKSRLLAMETAALASSIFLVGRKREGFTHGGTGGSPVPVSQGTGQRPVQPLPPSSVGSYETDVQPELETIVRERVETLWDQGIAGADLVIACVGAGLRAFTKYERVEYANGEEVPAERFLAEVETVVLDSIFQRLSKEVTVQVGQAAGLSGKPHRPAAGATKSEVSLAGVDPATRFYVLWRYTYKSAELDAGEAIIFANGTHVELDGPNGLSGQRPEPLVEKKKGKYRLRDYTERGGNDKLGMPNNPGGSPVPLIDALHRVLWLMERRPAELKEYLCGTGGPPVQLEQMRLVAQALAGPALKGGELSDVSPSAELSALAKLTANWKSVIEDNIFSAEEQADRKRGQKKLFE